MRKILTLLTVLALSIVIAYGQNPSVTGQVKDAKGEPVPFATIKIKGTNTGVAADATGSFKINAASGTTLVISATGYEATEFKLGASASITVSLSPSSALSEVVVTALGVSREKRSVGYAAQEIKGEDLTQTKQADLGTALAGKVSGVQVRGGSGAKFGASSLRIRGISSIDGGKNPLYVVDGVIVNSTDVNMDDVASLTVLKGPSATSVYGQRGENGVVVITTRRGTKGRGVGIEVNQSTLFEKVYTLPKYQNEYGGGYSQDWNIFKFNAATMDPALAAMDGAKYYDYYGDESWGPKMDGSLYAPWYSWDKTDPEYLKLKPYVAQPNNVRNYYNTGITANTNISFSKAGENYSTRVSFTNINRTGITPNSSQKKNYISYFGSITPFSGFTLAANLNANFTKSIGIPDEGYGTQTSGSFNQWWHRDLEIDKLRRYKRPDGTYTSWNINGPTNLAPKYWDNPFTEAYENVNHSNDSRVYGSLSASYNIAKSLKANFIARGNYYSYYGDNRTASGTLNIASFSTNQSRARENNYVWNLEYDNKFNDLSLRGGAYYEMRNNHNEDISMATAGGLTVPDFYNIAASKDRPTVSNSTVDKQVRSVYGFGSLGYKNMLFLELNLRNDWSSALPKANNSYLYGGVSTSFVFTELFQNTGFLSFGRIRGSVGRTGSDVDAYAIHQAYDAGALYGTTPSMSVPNQIPNENLKPTLSTSYELGTELRFLRNRVRFDFNYYNRFTKDQIISLTLPSTTGFSTALVNAGEIQNYGYEISLGGTPIKNKAVTWDIDMNLGINKNKINELYGDIKNFAWASFGYSGSNAVTANREVNKPFGTLMGLGFKRDGAGNVLIDDDGFPLTTPNVNFGTFLPDFTGGITSTVSYKGFHAGFSIDFQSGGKLLSITKANASGSGLSAETAGLNEKGNPKRDDPASGGGVLFPGIVESTGKPNATYVDAQTLYESELSTLWENWIYDASYVKLREVSIGYDLPGKLISKLGLQRASFYLVAQNPWLIYTPVKGIDPSQLELDWREGGQLPATRSLGFNLKLTF
ncbi:MAG: SusC/RagA family TonB-linked outer membrane protein [Chitinophagaceae bacterium]